MAFSMARSRFTCVPQTTSLVPQQPEPGARVHGRRRAHLLHLLNNPLPCDQESHSVRGLFLQLHGRYCIVLYWYWYWRVNRELVSRLPDEGGVQTITHSSCTGSLPSIPCLPLRTRRVVSRGPALHGQTLALRLFPRVAPGVLRDYTDVPARRTDDFQ